MSMANIGRRVVPAVLAVVLAACSSGGGAAAVGVPGGDPVTTVNSLVATVQAKAFDKLPDLACAASKSSIAGAFDPSSALSGALTGVSAADVLAAINVTMTNVTVGSAQVTGDTATVHVKADMKVDTDPAKVKDLIKKALVAAGQPTDDTTVNTAVAAMGSAFSSTQALDEDVTLKNEGGKWLLCE
jgi:hypothetical protein